MTAVSPEPTPATENLKHTMQSEGSSTGWVVSLPSASVAPNLFQAVQLGSASSRQRVWSQSLCSLAHLKVALDSFNVYSGREGPVNPASFRDFLELF